MADNDSPVVADDGDDDEVPVAPLEWSQDDQKLRDDQLNFYKGDVDRLNTVLRAFLKHAKAKTALLCSTGGHTITVEGPKGELDTDTIAALVSGAFAATRKLFDVFGEKNFTLTVQKGEHESVYLGLVGGRCLLTVLFDENTTQGAVQLFATKATKKLEQIFEQIEKGEGAGPGEDEQIDDDFAAGAENALDDLFG
ncbi:MAG: roadblock/LC7 domain-containing protein [Planctomycetota bacterium]